MASSETFDVILRLLMDEAALGRIKSGASTVAKEFEKVDNKTEEVTKEIQRQEKIAITAMKREAAAINRLASLRAKELGELKERAAWIESGAKPLFAAGVAGITSITLLAKKYIDTTEESNEVTKAWAASTEKVNAAQMRIGKIAAEAVLPLYEKLADIAEKGAEFVEKNPGAIEAGLKASIVLAGLGGLGLLAAKGMRLYADIKMIAVGDMQLTAAGIMSAAADKQLAAATGMKNPFATGIGTATKTATTVAAGTGTAAAGTGAIATATQAAMVVAAPIIAGILTKELINAVQRALGVQETSWADIGNTVRQAVELPTKLALMALRDLGLIAPETAAKLNEFQNALFGFGETQTAVAQSSQAATSATQNQAKANAQMAATANSTAAAAKNVSSGLSGVGSSIVSFIQRIISSIGGGSSSKPPTHDYTGYAYTRTYAMAQDGQRQFVMSGGMTRLAEQMLGGQLNQQAVLSAMANGVGGGRIVWQDQRRFSGEYTKSMRAAQRADTLAVLNDAASRIRTKRK